MKEPFTPSVDEYGVPYSRSYVMLPCRTVEKLARKKYDRRKAAYEAAGICTYESPLLHLLAKLIRVASNPEMENQVMHVTVDDLDSILE